MGGGAVTPQRPSPIPAASLQLETKSQQLGFNFFGPNLLTLRCTNAQPHHHHHHHHHHTTPTHHPPFPFHMARLKSSLNGSVSGFDQTPCLAFHERTALPPPPPPHTHHHPTPTHHPPSPFHMARPKPSHNSSVLGFGPNPLPASCFTSTQPHRHHHHHTTPHHHPPSPFCMVHLKSSHDGSVSAFLASTPSLALRL